MYPCPIYQKHLGLLQEELKRLPPYVPTPTTRPLFRFETDEEPTSEDLRREKEESRDWEEDA